MLTLKQRIEQTNEILRSIEEDVHLIGFDPKQYQDLMRVVDIMLDYKIKQETIIACIQQVWRIALETNNDN